MFLVVCPFNEDGEETATESAARFLMIDDDAAKGTKEIEQPREEGGSEFIGNAVLCVVTRERIDTACIHGFVKNFMYR